MSAEHDEHSRTRSARLRIASAPNRVTTFELFFDLVYVFAFTQLSRLMAETHSGLGILQALILLGLLWWTWESYGWLSNQAPADQGVMQVGMSIAMIAVFVTALTIPEAFHDLPGGWHAPLVLALAYALVRVIHTTLYMVAAGDDAALRRQVLLTQAVAMAPATAALIVGAVVGGPAQTWIWLGAFLYYAALTYASSRGGGGWRLHSPVHWAERHGLIVILALGESIVAIGVGVAREPIDGPITIGVALAVTLSILLWWAYFARASAAGELALERRSGAARVVLARDAYTYVHVVIVAGVILAALGVEEAMTHIGAPEPLGWFGASALAAGLALFASATALFGRLVDLPWPGIRLVAALVLAASVPVLAAVPAVWALVIVVAVLAAMVALEAAQRAPVVE
ncbi:low temperature requirement protein A [Agromyces sp. ISL-38]|uniref:low temperature requirement protein A n=1 Tax=Agromyces sp. ISL-38 TaxID=2819107 RepID=UPI001BE834DC|nr:low temperature requirement protein A [Agromyces sp. ISL-38]MBT2497687.1 low temperature requirement protein A [Agromyces sp. ISL-38]